jgi:hypothetical protein
VSRSVSVARNFGRGFLYLVAVMDWASRAVRPSTKKTHAARIATANG